VDASRCLDSGNLFLRKIQDLGEFYRELSDFFGVDSGVGIARAHDFCDFFEGQVGLALELHVLAERDLHDEKRAEHEDHVPGRKGVD